MEHQTLDHAAVMRILPHRDPMLLVDTVTDLEPMVRVETVFCVRPEWDIFRGHFPGDPVLPGVLSVECMAQACDVMLMTAERYAGKTPLFAGLDSVRFRRKIVPGECVTARCAVKEEIQAKGKIICEARLFVGEDLAVTADITVAMR